MQQELNNYNQYFKHLNKLSYTGLIYQRLFKAPLLYYHLRCFGQRVIEIGSGIGNGVLGSYPSYVVGIDVNPLAVSYCQSKGFNVKLIKENEKYPFGNSIFNCCLLDNVLEHIQNSKFTLDECYRITDNNGGLVVVVPGIMGYNHDSDHKIYYDEKKLRDLDPRWELISLISLPFIFKSIKLSKLLRQYCLMAIYKKISFKD